MQCLSVVVLRQIVSDTVQSKSAASDAVRHTSHRRTEESLAGIVHIFLTLSITDDDIVNVSVSVRCEKADYTGTEIGHLHGKVTIAQCIQVQLVTYSGRRVLIVEC